MSFVLPLALFDVEVDVFTALCTDVLLALALLSALAVALAIAPTAYVVVVLLLLFTAAAPMSFKSRGAMPLSSAGLAVSAFILRGALVSIPFNLD